jgi:dihydrofolate synthase/folylpolyglutamate synthase
VNPLDYLFALDQFGIKFGLDNIRAIVARLGHPERACRTVHIAGTNGKGSVTAMVDEALRAAGHRTARYTSPHLVDLSERFVVDGCPVAQAPMLEAIDDVRDVIEALRADGSLDVQPTFFEVATAVAFELFRRAGVNVAVIEVGLGGRLDATNVVLPMATAITSIAYDHQLYLGHTLREIAGEKAGIVKAGVPLVIGDLVPEAEAAIVATATRVGAPIHRVTADAVRGWTIGLAGRHQRINAAIAAEVLRVVDASGLAVPSGAITRGIADARWPGRLDRRRLDDGRVLLLDAAHNAAGAAALADFLATDGPPRPLLFAAMKDKDVSGMLRALLPHVTALVVTKASNARAGDPAELAAAARAIAPALSVTIEPSVAAALDEAWRRAANDRAITVAGSIFLLGDVLQRLGLHC